MRAKLDPGRSPSQRPRVLLLAHACNPYKGSDAGVGWARALEAAKRFDAWVICGHWDRPDIHRFLTENGDIPGLHFCFVDKMPWENLLGAGSPFYDINYLLYNLWHRRAYKLAAGLHQELKFDLVHQVTRVGFREPGYLWQLDSPFIWGPVGGTQNYPLRFLLVAGAWGAFKEGLRSLINLLQLHLSPRLRRAARKAAFVVAANSQVQRDLERVYEVKSPRLLDTGIKEVENSPKLFRPEGPLRLLWSGRFDYHKALPLLLQALAKVPSTLEYELRILGTGPLQGRWQKMARSLGLDPYCQWLGWLSQDQALKQYHWADILVFTSLRDTSGNVVLEAFSHGVPVICLDHQGVADMVTENCGVKIPVTTPKEVIGTMGEVICRLAKDRTALPLLSIGALARAHDFLWSHNGEQMAELYYAALKGSKAINPGHDDHQYGLA